MAIYKYVKKVKGKTKEFYLVTAEAVNKYSGKRHQKKRRGISSRPKAEKIYKELWNQCLNEKPNVAQPRNWIELKALFLQNVKLQVRTSGRLSGLSPRTYDLKKGRLGKTTKWDELHIELITPKFVQEELEILVKNEKISYSTYRKVFCEVKEVFQFAVESGILNFNSFSGVKIKSRSSGKRKQALTHEEANFLLNEAHKRNHPHYFIWLMALATGMRRSELAGLKWTDIDFENGLAYVQRQRIPREGVVDKTKSGRDRTVALPQYLLPILKAEKLKSDDSFVISVNCYQWRDGKQAKILREFCREIGIKEITFHQLRATHITLAIVDNISLGIIKENVGHSKLSTTDIYFRSSGINMKGQTDGLSLKVPQEKEGTLLPLKVTD